MQRGNPSDARPGDRIAIEGRRLGGGRRAGEILEVLGEPGHEYLRVRWEDGRETLFHPGGDAILVSSPGAAPVAHRHPGALGRKAASEQGSSERRPRESARRRRRPYAEVGDRLVIKGHHLGEPDRDAEILEVLGPGGAPPYRVRWEDDGRVSELFPGSDAVIDHMPHRREAKSKV